ncbi:MAG: NUDIX domain-containing protein [Candidatus Pacearchaeota archaeon]
MAQERNSKYRKAVFVLAYSLESKSPQYILLKRKLHWKGWEFPKGKIEKGENKIQTARRELREETGHKTLKIKKFNYSGRYKYHKLLPDRPRIIGQTFALYAAEVKKGKASLDPKEHSGHKWVDFKTALKMLKWPNQKKSLRMVNEWLNSPRRGQV